MSFILRDMGNPGGKALVTYCLLPVVLTLADQEAYCLNTNKPNKKFQKASAIRVVYHFLLQVLIVCSTGLAGIMLLNYQRDYTIWVLPLIIVCLFAFLVAHCFLSIYEMVVDVLFLCFAIDTKYNDGSPGREFYMDKVLMVSFPLLSKFKDLVP